MLKPDKIGADRHFQFFLVIHNPGIFLHFFAAIILQDAFEQICWVSSREISDATVQGFEATTPLVLVSEGGTQPVKLVHVGEHDLLVVKLVVTLSQLTR